MPEPRAEDLARDRAAEVQALGKTSARLMEQAAPTPERELERIAALRKAGKHDEADKALAEFRKRYPDYKIPEAMLEKVERR
jgi:TolA-binding protein